MQRHVTCGGESPGRNLLNRSHRERVRDDTSEDSTALAPWRHKIGYDRTASRSENKCGQEGKKHARRPPLQTRKTRPRVVLRSIPRERASSGSKDMPAVSSAAPQHDGRTRGGLAGLVRRKGGFRSKWNRSFQTGRTSSTASHSCHSSHSRPSYRLCVSTVLTRLDSAMCMPPTQSTWRTGSCTVWVRCAYG